MPPQFTVSLVTCEPINIYCSQDIKMRPQLTFISVCACIFWIEQFLAARGILEELRTIQYPKNDSSSTARMHKLIWVSVVSFTKLRFQVLFSESRFTINNDMRFVQVYNIIILSGRLHNIAKNSVHGQRIAQWVVGKRNEDGRSFTLNAIKKIKGSCV